MDYAIALSARRGEMVEGEIAGLFNDDALSELWEQMSVTSAAWDTWRRTGGQADLVPEYPILSLLAFIDEGEVVFQTTDLASECTRLVQSVRSATPAALLRSLSEAAERGIATGATISAFPAASGEQAGDVFRYRPL